MRVFSKAAFRKSESGRRLVKQMGKHLDILDGMAVKEWYENGNGGCGRIEYQMNGEDWELFPIDPEWCVEVLDEID